MSETPRQREVTRVRLVLNLEVMRGSRWRELAPFREAVLFHFAPAALRGKVVALCEAMADQILEEVTENVGLDEPEARAHLRAVIADLEHGAMALREVAALAPDETEVPQDREALRRSLRLAKHLERELLDLNGLIGPAPPESAAERGPKPRHLTEEREIE